MQRKLLIAGGAGYIGTDLLQECLDTRKYSKVGIYDIFYLGKKGIKNIQEKYGKNAFQVIEGDIRTITERELRGYTDIINLAGISNDPSSLLNPELTQTTNGDGCKRIAEKAKQAGVKRFVDMSSCSVYGQLDDMGEEEGMINPQTLYARLKQEVEEYVASLHDENFCTTSIRNATTYGLGKSMRTRFDLVLNAMTLGAYENGNIKVDGDGKQERPLIHVRDISDMCLHILDADSETVGGQTFNALGGNTTIISLAHEIKRQLSFFGQEVSIDLSPNNADSRSYQVSDKKMRETLFFSPQKKVSDGVQEIYDGLREGIIEDSPECHTIYYYQQLLKNRQHPVS